MSMDRKEFKEAWNTVVKIYEETRFEVRGPELATQKIVEALGRDKALEAFATVVQWKKWDGRISSRNRERLGEIEINSDNLSVNAAFSGLDKIHTAHIDQLIDYLYKEG